MILLMVFPPGTDNVFNLFGVDVKGDNLRSVFGKSRVDFGENFKHFIENEVSAFVSLRDSLS